MEIIHMIERHIELIKVIGVTVGAGIALWQYRKQQKFKRIQSLSTIWQKFFSEKDLLRLFKLFYEDSYTEVRNTPFEEKLKFLALLEEVALYIERYEVDKKHAVYLFKWHFHFVYTNEETKKAFWYNPVLYDKLSEDEIKIKINKEIDAGGWSKQKKLARECSREIHKK